MRAAVFDPPSVWGANARGRFVRGCADARRRRTVSASRVYVCRHSQQRRSPHGKPKRKDEKRKSLHSFFSPPRRRHAPYRRARRTGHRTVHDSTTHVTLVRRRDRRSRARPRPPPTRQYATWIMRSPPPNVPKRRWTLRPRSRLTPPIMAVRGGSHGHAECWVATAEREPLPACRHAVSPPPECGSTTLAATRHPACSGCPETSSTSPATSSRNLWWSSTSDWEPSG